MTSFNPTAVPGPRVHAETLTLALDGRADSANITDQVQAVVQRSTITAGLAVVLVQHTTAAVVVAEHEAGILVDLAALLERLAPEAGDYFHHRRGHDTNGAAHLRSALLGVSVTLPVAAGRLQLGAYQEILVLEFESRPRLCQVLVQVLGI